MLFYRVLELAVAHDPVRYADIAAGRRPRAVPPTPPRAYTHPPSLDQPPAGRPWRARSCQVEIPKNTNTGSCAIAPDHRFQQSRGGQES